MESPRPSVLCRLALAAALATALAACSREAKRPHVLLVGVDGGSWETVRKLRGEGRLPNLGRLIDEGAAGRLHSLLWKRGLAGHRGYWSPVLWATLATGKLPDRHGIEDFVMPAAEHQRFWLTPGRTGEPATLRMPPLPHGEVRLAVQARTPSALARQTVSVSAGGKVLGTLELGRDESVAWLGFTSAGAWSEPVLELRCAETGPPVAGRSVCLELSLLRLYDAHGRELLDFHPLRDQRMLQEGWAWSRPRERIPSASFHRRAQAIWQIASARRLRAGVVGWWTTWPAEAIDGVVYSALLGVHGARATNSREWFDQFEGLAHPASALERARELFFPIGRVLPEISERFYEPGKCDCVGQMQDRTFREFYWEDRYFMQLALDLYENDRPFDLMAVYLRGIDTSGHMFLHLGSNDEFLQACGGEGCDRERMAQIVERYYDYVDEQLGALLAKAPEGTVTAIVTDHGQAPARTHGDHADNGFIILHGGPVTHRVLRPAQLVDVTPTLLYLLGLPVAQDMDGSVLVDAIEPGHLEANPVRYVRSYEQPFDLGQKEEIVDPQAMDEERERMEALGYVE
jgi:hypothetical protein